MGQVSKINVGGINYDIRDKNLEHIVDGLESHINSLALGKFYGFYPTEEQMPNGNAPGYAYVGVVSPYSIYNYDGTTWVDSGVKENRGEGQIVSLEDMAGYDLTLNPVEMRLFLQSAIDYAAAKKATLVFPKGKTFVIDMPSANKTIYDCEGGDGLSIPSNITIDFNFSTIKAATNHWWCYNVIRVLPTSENVTLMNGYVVGDRDTHIMSTTISSKTRGTTDEWNLAIYVMGTGKVNLINMDCSNVRGDGISIEGEINWNHTQAVKGSQVLLGKDVDTKGNIIDDSSSVTTDLLTLSSYYTTDASKNGIKTFIAPRTNTDKPNANIDESRYLKISYYNDYDSFVSQETIKMGDALTIPIVATKIRISQVVGSLSDAHEFWVTNILWNLQSTITQCNIHDCGRNGIVPTICKKLRIEKCIIKNIFGTNNQVGIDIEGSSYVQGDIVIDSCIIDNPGYYGIIASQGEHIIVQNCNCVGCSISLRTFDSHIINCKAEQIGHEVSLSQVFDNDLVFPKSTIENCIANYIRADYSLVTNCYVNGGTGGSLRHRHTEKVQSVFTNCKIASIDMGYAIYENCEINSTEKLAFNPSQGVLTFKNCKIEVPYIRPTAQCRFIGCDIVLLDDGNDIFDPITDVLKDNTIETKGASNSSKFHVILVGENCEVSGNTYKGKSWHKAISLDVLGQQIPKKVIVKNNLIISDVDDVSATLFAISSGLRNAVIYSSYNAVMAKWKTITDYALPTDLTDDDKLEIYDIGLYSETNLTPLQNERIKRLVWQ